MSIPLSQDILSQLQDQSIADIDRIALAYKAELGCKQAYLLKVCGVSRSRFYRLRKLIESGEKKLTDAYRCGWITLEEALRALEHPELMDNPILDELRRQGADIRYQNRKFVLYRLNSELFLSVTHLCRAPITYKLDDFPFVESLVSGLLRDAENGIYKISVSLRIVASDGTNQGDFRHHIISARSGLPIDIVRSLKIYEARKDKTGNTHDWRLCNMRNRFLADIVPGLYQGRTTFCEGNEQYAVNTDGSIVITDRSAEMSLIFAAFPWHCESRDHRTVLVLGNGKKVALSRLVAACGYYGSIPTTQDGITSLLEQFNDKFPLMEVDHLNGCVQDCRLQNLMIVTRSQNLQKEMLQKRLKKLSSGCFADAVRVDDTHVHLIAGKRTAAGKSVIEIDCELDFNGYLTILKYYIESTEKKEEK